MKKLFLILFMFMWYLVSYGQRVSVNVHVRSGNQRMYFQNSKVWMKNHGYRYHPNGYYTGNNRRIYPTRREYYHWENNRWDNNRVYYRSRRTSQRGHINQRNNGRYNNQGNGNNQQHKGNKRGSSNNRKGKK